MMKRYRQWSATVLCGMVLGACTTAPHQAEKTDPVVTVCAIHYRDLIQPWPGQAPRCMESTVVITAPRVRNLGSVTDPTNHTFAGQVHDED